MTGSLGRSQRALALLVVLVLSSIVVGISVSFSGPRLLDSAGWRQTTAETLARFSEFRLIPEVFANPDDCVALGGAISSGECQISGAVTKSGTFNLDETLHILGTGSITVPALSGGNALTLNIKGDLIIDVGGQLIGDVSTAGGIGATVSINADGDIVLHGVGASGARISSSQSAGSCSGGRGGNINLDAGGRIVVEPGSVIAANSNRCRAGDIAMTAGGIISVDGLVSSGTGTTVNPLPGRLTGQVLSGGGTMQAGGKITIVCNSLSSPALTVSKEGIIVSQGEDPGADTVMIEGCDVEINGLVASVGKKQKAEVILRSGDHITINGQDLGQTDINSYPNQGRVRADNTLDGADRSKVDIFARGSINIKGPPSGTIFVVTSNPGTATNRRPGFITVISLEDKITATGKAFQAGRSGAGDQGGTIDLKAKLDIDLDGASVTIEALGDYTPTYGTGGKINLRSFSGGVTWTYGLGDVRPTGNGTVAHPIAPEDRGVITLTACTIVDITGTSFPYIGSPTTPTTSAGVCSPSAPTLPEGVADLPYCSIITIIKDTVPDDAQDFSFTTTGGLNPSSFTLDDDPLDPTWPNNQTYTRVASGSYNVTETLPVAGFELTNLVCIDPDGGTTVDLGAGTATIDVDASETITCTFTNEPPAVLTGSITIIKDTKPDDPQDFSYTTAGSGLSDFSLDDDGDNTNGLSNSTTFSGLGPGNYGVNETLPVAGFSLTGISCEVTGDGTIATPNQATGEVSITLGAGGTATCTFTNEKSCKWCTKSAVLSQVEQNVGKCCDTPDIIVDLRLPSDTVNETRVGTSEPATGSLQAAVDYINLHGDLNGDGALFIGVTAQDCGTGTVGSGDCSGQTGRGPYGDGVENVVIENKHEARLNVFGCSVDLTAEDPDMPVIWIKDSVGKVTVLDIHVHGSHVAGYLIENNDDLVVVKNSRSFGASGIGYWIKDDDVEITGSPEISGHDIGILVEGNNVKLRTNNDIVNNGIGIKITGDNNESNGNDVGKEGKPNGTGILVEGKGNLLHGDNVMYNTGDGIVVDGSGTSLADGNFVTDEDTQYNGGDGIVVSGNYNTLDRNHQVKFNTGDGIEVSGNSNLLNENVAEDNGGHGINVSGNENTLKKNEPSLNGGDGIHVTGDQNVLDENTADKNGENGIKAVEADGAEANDLKKNRARDNDSHGILACGQIDSGENKGEGNGEDPQVDFTCGVAAPVEFFVADDQDNKVYKYDASGVLVGSFSLSGGNADPSGVAVVGSNVYVLDKKDYKVYKYDESSGALLGTSKLLKSSAGKSLSTPTGLAVDGDDLWVVDDGKKIYRYSLSDAFSGSGNLNALQEITFNSRGGNGSAEGLAIDATYLYVLDDGDKQVYRYNRDGTGTGSPFASKVLKEVGGGSLSSPSGATAGDGSLWIVDRGKDKLYQYDLVSLFSASGNLRASSEFRLDPANGDARGI